MDMQNNAHKMAGLNNVFSTTLLQISSSELVIILLLLFIKIFWPILPRESEREGKLELIWKRTSTQIGRDRERDRPSGRKQDIKRERERRGGLFLTRERQEIPPCHATICGVRP